MISKEEINNLKRIRTIDSSDLSSDISDKENENEKEKENNNISPIQRNDKPFIEEFEVSCKNNIKRPRFFSEDFENGYIKKQFYKDKNLKDSKLKNINKKLKNMVKDELIYSKERKFTFS